MHRLIGGAEMLHMVQRTLNHVDPRLVWHGERVAWLVLKMMDEAGYIAPHAVREVGMLAMLHDVGAYKTEEIDQLVRFESENVWQHSVYGYLFLTHLSPLKHLAPAVLHHHTDFALLERISTPHKGLAQAIYLADRIDTFTQARGRLPEQEELRRFSRGRFSDEVVEVYAAAAGHNDLFHNLSTFSFAAELDVRMEAAPFTAEEIDANLRMVISAIDFRSPHTVTHSMTTERVSAALAQRMNLSEEERRKIRCGALLHDLGKIAIPVEILEHPGKLSTQAMQVMRTHVEITGQILGDRMDPEIKRIAVRHHEKLDGTGYPDGVRGEEMTLPERIVAVADITSALSGTRSYKAAFDATRVCDLIQKMTREGALCAQVVDTLLGDYDGIMAEVAEGCAPLISAYQSIQSEYTLLLEQMQAMSPPRRAGTAATL